jgi:alpha-tubulin suppressor-like RCC1 family protein
MLNSQILIDKICSKINCGGLTDLETCQVTNALTILSNPVYSVSTFNNLPVSDNFIGRMIFVQDESRYYFYSGTVWSNEFSTKTSSFLIKSDESFSWGHNSLGRLGDGTTTSRSSPVSVVGGFTDWCQISAGRYHSLGLRTNGTAWAWGNNSYGRLGDGTTTTRSSPVSVVGGFTDWLQVSAACAHSLGVRTDGTAWAWGCGAHGRLGSGTTNNTSSPVSVVGGFTDWCQVSAHGSHSLGVRTNGTAWAWGANSYGRLGDGTTISRSSPVSVVGGFTDWCQVSAGECHSLGVRSNGTAWAWGYNNCGRLGDGTTISKTSPVSVVGGFTDWCQISAGSGHSLGVRTDGTAWAWGCGAHGRLGDGISTNKSSPVSVVGGFTDWCQVSAGGCHSLGLRTNGTAWAWGQGCCGQLGDGTTSAKSSPVSVLGRFSDWCQVSAGACHSIGVRTTAKVN